MDRGFAVSERVLVSRFRFDSVTTISDSSSCPLECVRGACNGIVGNTEGEAEKSGCAKSASGDSEYPFFLKSGTEGNIVAPGSLGEDIECALGWNKIKPSLFQNLAE